MATSPRVRLHIERMAAGDLPDVMSIDRASFPAPWPEAAFLQELNNRNGHFFVAREAGAGAPQRSALRRLLDRGAPQPGPIVGYAGMWMFFDEAHIATIAVRPERRGQGIGEQLLVFLIDLAGSLDAIFITLEVRVSNDAAQRLYAKHGFLETGRRKRYYHDNGEDALIMTLELAAGRGARRDAGRE